MTDNNNQLTIMNNDNDDGITTIKVAGEVLLPSEQHQLYCWKVRNGSAVQRGETIALAILKQKNNSKDPTATKNHNHNGESSSTLLSSSSSTSTTTTEVSDTVKKPSATTSTSSSSSSAHRRPTKRRRPGAIAAIAAATEAATAAADTASETDPAVSTDNDEMKKQQQQQQQLPQKVATSSSAPASEHARVPILATADGLVRMGTSSSSLLNSKKSMNPLLIGYIEACSHSTVVESLCAVCGARVEIGGSKKRSRILAGLGLGGDDIDIDDDDDDDEETNNGAMSRVTVSGGITVSVSAVEGQRMALQDAERLQRQRKLSLVLDLDHTLLHATNDVRARQEALSRDDVRTLVLPMVEDNVIPNQQYNQQQQQQQQQIMWMQHFVKLRPGVKEFLESAMTMYEIGVYTAGTRSYAEQITIILARHLVGAKRDQPDLDHLRHEFARVQRLLLEDSSRIQPRLAQEINNNNDNNDCKKPAAKAVTAPNTASSSSSNTNDPKDSAKTDDTFTNGNMAMTRTVTEKDDIAPVRTEPSSEATAKETAVTCNGAIPATQVQVDDKKSSADNKATVSSKTSVPVNKDEADADKLNKKAANGDSKTDTVAAAALLDEDAEKKSTIKDNKEDDSTEKKDDSEHSLKSAFGEDDGDKKKAAKGTGKKRKRVTFGDTPPTVKSDKQMTTSEELEKLRAELHEAERMEAMAQDLKQRLFGSRVVSRTDVKDLGTDVKSLKRIFPCGGTMAVVVDDREDVWANAGDTHMVPKGEPPHNLLVVRPYHWNHFLGYADVNNASGEDLAAELDNSNKSKQYDNDQDEKQLLWTGDILRRIHQRYYGEETATTKTATRTPVKSRLTVPELVRNMRREVLMGTKIILSGLVPLHRQQEEGGRTSSRLRPAFVRYAENLGAIILPRVGPGLTHVVAAKDGTEKIMNARAKIPGCWIVKATWLMEAAWSLKRPESLAHVLGPPPKIQTKSDSSDDDDDLAAELENELIGE